MKKPKVLISVPNTGWVHKHVCFALLKLIQDPRVQSNIILPTNSPYVNNLHKIRKDFLAGDWDYWITFDSDNPPRNNPIDLVFLNKDVIGCPTPVWANMKKGDFPVYWNSLTDIGQDDFLPLPPEKRKGLQQVDAVGSGCLVIARRVMEAIKAPFMRIWDEDGIVYMGGDYAFCKRVREHGFEVWTHFDYCCHHFNEIEIGEIVEAFTLNEIKRRGAYAG